MPNAERGRRDGAAALMHGAMAALPPGAGPLTERMDPKGGFPGNPPQSLGNLALVHAALSHEGGTGRVGGEGA